MTFTFLWILTFLNELFSRFQLQKAKGSKMHGLSILLMMMEQKRFLQPIQLMTGERFCPNYFPLRISEISESCPRSEEHTSELQSRGHLVCRLLLEKKNKIKSQQ